MARAFIVCALLTRRQSHNGPRPLLTLVTALRRELFEPARRPPRVQLHPTQQSTLRPGPRQFPLEARELRHEPVVGRRRGPRVSDGSKRLLERQTLGGHDVRGAHGGAAALPREAVHQHPAPVQQALGDELEAPIEVNAEALLGHVFDVDALVDVRLGKLGLESPRDGEDVRDAQALEHLAVVRGADGPEEDVGDNLRRLAVGLDLLGCGKREGRGGGKTEGQSTVKKVLRLWARGARAGRGEGGYARASRATAGGGIGSDRPRGNSIETRDDGMARAPCDGRGAREKRVPRPMSRPRVPRSA
mmetsp:Transcript_14411/g.56872  ORF Transcript_14411/g.56872 Transcript_14411/m.56872 type:complete len:303 (-) Transcript_14411:629-1537(-)